MQREIFELIEKVYFHDFVTVPPLYEQEAAQGLVDSSEFELRRLSSSKKLSNDDAEVDDGGGGVGDGGGGGGGEEPLHKQEIEATIKRLRIQLDVVGRKCSDIILQNSQAYSVELKRVSDFKCLLEDSYQICAIARRALSMSEFMFVLPSLKLVKKQIKKAHLVKLYSAVNEIKSFVSLCLIPTGQIAKNKTSFYLSLKNKVQ